ncbi:hypothetical protein BJ165DRAFT_1551998 [Panaeolus papilionaceus]|nr:hypothetical protein BJ165DRAFT_1551998 [Panaeolus papilionaceus]
MRFINTVFLALSLLLVGVSAMSLPKEVDAYRQDADFLQAANRELHDSPAQSRKDADFLAPVSLCANMRHMGHRRRANFYRHQYDSKELGHLPLLYRPPRCIEPQDAQGYFLVLYFFEHFNISLYYTSLVTTRRILGMNKGRKHSKDSTKDPPPYRPVPHPANLSPSINVLERLLSPSLIAHLPLTPQVMHVIRKISLLLSLLAIGVVANPLPEAKDTLRRQDTEFLITFVVKAPENIRETGILASICIKNNNSIAQNAPRKLRVATVDYLEFYWCFIHRVKENVPSLPSRAPAFFDAIFQEFTAALLVRSIVFNNYD